MTDRIDDRKAVLTYIQQILYEQGLYKGRIDGLWGPNTRNGIKTMLRYANMPTVPSNSQVDRWLAYFIQLWGLQNGQCLKFDGWWGADTEEAFDVLSGAGSPVWKDEIEKQHDGLESPVWPTQAAVRSGTSLFGMPGSHNLKRFESPIPLRLAWNTGTVVSTISCHEQIRDSVITALETIRAAYDKDTIQALGIDLYGGCYNDRAVRGGTRKSMHAWGIAFDFNPLENRLKWDHRRAAFAQSEYEPMMRAWYAVGAINLGREINRDWMHFQFARLR